MKFFSSRILPATLVALLALLPLAAVLAYGVRVPIEDEWDHLEQLVRLEHGQLHLADLFARYNEHRLVFTRVVLYALDLASGFDNRWSMRLSGLLVAACIAMLTASTMSGGWTARGLWKCVPVALVFANLRQLDGLLWGWAVQAYLCLALSVAALVVLKEGQDRRRVLAFCGLSLLAAASWAAGIAVFPAALLQWWCARPRHDTTGARFRLGPLAITMTFALTSVWLAWGVPLESSGVRFGERATALLLLLGSPLSGDPALATVAGASLLAVSTLVLSMVATHRLRLTQGALPVGVLSFGLGAALLLAIGRASADWHDLLNARYVAVLATIPAGLWLLLLQLQPTPPALPALAALLALATLWAAATGAREAVALGPVRQTERRLLAWFARTAALQTDQTLHFLGSNTPAVRRGAQSLERLHWNVWRSDEAAPRSLSAGVAVGTLELLNGGPIPSDTHAVLQLPGETLFDIKGRALDAAGRAARVFIAIDDVRLPAYLEEDSPEYEGRFRAQLWLRPLGLGLHRVRVLAGAEGGSTEALIAAPIWVEVLP